MPTYKDKSGRGTYSPKVYNIQTGEWDSTKPYRPRLRIRLWHKVHIFVNAIAWASVRANRDHEWHWSETPMRHPIWRLNNWIARQYLDEMIRGYPMIRITRERPQDDGEGNA